MAISLHKGQRISLTKVNGPSLQQMCIGVNWGAIEKKGFFGKKIIPVDLDASVGAFNHSGGLLDTIYFGHKMSKCGAIVHSGDDTTGDTNGDDGLDNEVIQIDLAKLDPNVEQLAFVLNSFRGQDFKDIPFAKIRIYEGTPDRVDQVLATFDIANDSSFSGSVSLIMGKLYKQDSEWRFHSIGDTTKDKNLEQTLKTFAQHSI